MLSTTLSSASDGEGGTSFQYSRKDMWDFSEVERDQGRDDLF